MAHVILQVLLEVEHPQDDTGDNLKAAVEALLEDNMATLTDELEVLSASVVFEDVV